MTRLHPSIREPGSNLVNSERAMLIRGMAALSQFLSFLLFILKSELSKFIMGMIFIWPTSQAHSMIALQLQVSSLFDG